MLGGKLAQGFFGQMVRFVDAIKAVFRRRQNHAAAHADVGEQQIVVGHHHIHALQRVARQIKRAFRPIGAGRFEAAVAVVGDFKPHRIVDFLRPDIAIAIETARGKLIGQIAQHLQLFRAGLALPQHCGRFHAEQVLLGVALGELIELIGAQIAAAPFGQRKRHFQPRMRHQKR